MTESDLEQGVHLDLGGFLATVMELTGRDSRPPLQASGDLLATACVTAAVMHPEWAAAFASHASEDVRALADAIVAASPVERITG